MFSISVAFAKTKTHFCAEMEKVFYFANIPLHKVYLALLYMNPILAKKKKNKQEIAICELVVLKI